ncbi:hypothetical protein RUND412_000344 [Rhizina undulata]
MKSFIAYGGAFACLLASAAATNGYIGIDDILGSWKDSPYASYPTKFTRDIIPIGHEESSLTPNRTFESLYIDPLVSILARQNPQTPFVTSPTRNGVYDTLASQTLFLFVDVKTSGAETFPAVVSALEPLRALNYLTTVNGSTVTLGPVTVIGTGNTPLDQVAPLSQRDYFFDGPLQSLAADNITQTISPIASASFADAIGTVLGPELSADQLASLRSQVKAAHDLGIWVRYWDLPQWPVLVRNGVWKTLLEEGVDLLNADLLEEAAEML